MFKQNTSSKNGKTANSNFGRRELTALISSTKHSQGEVLL